ncbi:MAG: rod shape-determining protein MreD [Candidatus Portnoybacteria bacterium]|nr:rod shape-determining protein MreD [Candidatus Portnoybacteria bacterium]
MKTGFFLLFSALILAVLLQTTVFPHLEIYGVMPNLVLVVVILTSLSADWRTTLFLALAGGLSLDFFSTSSFGLFALTFIVIGFSFSFLKSYLFTQANIFVSLISVLAGTVLCYFIVVLLIGFLSLFKFSVPVITLRENIFIQFSIEAFYNLVVTVFAFWGLSQNRFSLSDFGPRNRWI